ncbi:hypothetical protein [Flavobacterium sp.]|uniref:hypothetical protein n=1 Tax=Flavobacterium sp. TaxID=239 RepID=UPI00404742A5
MRKIEISQMELTNAGGVGNVINGVCAAYTGAALVGIVTFAFATGGWGIAIGAGCLVNSVGTSNNWWSS